MSYTRKKTYIAFAWAATQCAPNKDPYTSAFRIAPGSEQVRVSAEAFKQAVRRGLFASSHTMPEYAGRELASVYGLKDAILGKPRMTETLDRVKHNFEIKDSQFDLKDYTTDAPLFGIVQTKNGSDDTSEAEAESQTPASGKKTKKPKPSNNASLPTVSAVRNLYIPATVHPALITAYGRNNQMTGEGKEAAGSNITELLEFGYFMTIMEVNHYALSENIKTHKVLDQDTSRWIDMLIGAIWAAYTTDRSPSASQANQFARFLLAWDGESTEDPVDPATYLYKLFEQPSMDAISTESTLISAETAPGPSLSKALRTFNMPTDKTNFRAIKTVSSAKPLIDTILP